MPIDLGPFRLRNPIARGGMGQVWRGEHREQRVPVAIKIVAVDASDAAARQAFSNEMRALAGLDHNCIVHLFDHGVVDVDAARQSKGAMTEGQPYMVMEYATGGSLDQRTTMMGWTDLRATLLSVLDALSHAHSRGVVHRDLKPANLLVCTDADMRPGLKLTDFGIAHLQRNAVDNAEEQVAGTLHFMSPEQVYNNWRDFGPWTDLYAFGCMAYQLAAGHVPFASYPRNRLVIAHVRHDPPPLNPLIPVPAGYAEWVSRLMAKPRHDRFQRAADAAWALVNLGNPPGMEEPSERGPAKAFEPPPKMSPRPPMPTVELDFDWDDDVDEDDFADVPTVVGHDPDDEPTQAAPRPYDPDEEPTHAAAPIRPGAASDPAMNVPTPLGGNDPDMVTLVPDITVGDTLGDTTRLYLPVGSATYGGDIPPVPRTWKRPQEAPLSISMVGAGLRLYGVRTVPMIDRVRERDVVWKALLQVHRTGTPRAVVVHGPAGTGKSRVVNWICERAHEVGAADVLRAVHGPLLAPGESILRMFERYFMTHKLPHDGVEQRVIDFLAHHDEADQDFVFALTEFLSPKDDDTITARLAISSEMRRALLEDAIETDHGDFEDETEETDTTTRLVRLQTAGERHRVALRALRLISEERPAIVVLEDVQWGEHALQLASHVMRSDLPVLLLLTAREEELVENSTEATRLAELQASSRTTSVELGPLHAKDHHALIEQLLHLESSLAARVAERTAGNPLFAVELVGDWVQRGLFAVSDAGFVLRPGVTAPLPDDLHEVWDHRISRALEGLQSEARAYLERASALGLEVDDEEWMEVCDDPTGKFAMKKGIGSGGVVFSPKAARIRYRLVDRLLTSHLAVETSVGWQFTHQMIRESLERKARDQGSWRAHNMACAHMLRRRVKRKQPGVNERLGLHLKEAGSLEACLGPLMKGVDERAATTGYRPALALLGTCEDVMTGLGLSDADERWGQLWLSRASLCFLRSDHDTARRWADRALKAAQAHDWTATLREGLFQRAQVALRKSELDAAFADLEALGNSLEDDYVPEMRARALFGLAAVARYRHDYDDAYSLYGEACRNFTAAADQKGAASCWRDMGAIELIFDNPERAMALYRRSLDVYEMLGNRLEMANCINGFAEVARSMGDLDEAERGYQRALELYDAVGGGQHIVPRLNLAMVRLKRGQYEEARDAFDEAREVAENQGRPTFNGASHVGLLTCAAGLQDWDAWDHHLRPAVVLLRETGFADPDLAWCLLTAGNLCFANGQKERAAHAYNLARNQYKALDDLDRAKDVDKRLAACGVKRRR